MLFQAEEEHQLDLAEIVMIGDTWRDVVAGQGAGVRTCFLGNAAEGEKLKADYVAADLSSFVSI